MTPANVAGQLGITRATARRALLTLESIGYMSSDGKQFSLTPKILALSQAYLSSTQVSNHIWAIVKRASIAVDETCSFGIRDDNEVIIVARHFSSRLQNLLIEIGTRLPMDVTALGRAILAGLPEHEIDAYLEQLNLQKFTSETITSKAKLKKIVLTFHYIQLCKKLKICTHKYKGTACKHYDYRTFKTICEPLDFINTFYKVKGY